MKSRKFISLLLIVALMISAFALTSCKVKDSSEDSNKDSAKKVLTVYTNAEFPPFEYLADNKPVGVDMQIAQAIADELGMELSIQNVKFDTILTSISSGKGDLGIAGITVTPERAESVDFSNNYATSTQYILYKDGASITTIEDLAGLKIGVQLGTTGDFIISDEINGVDDEETGEHTKGVLEGTGATVTQYNSAADAAVNMNTGKVDVVVIDKLPAEIVASQYNNFKTIELVYADGSKTDESYAVAVKKGNKELLEAVNKVIDRLIDDGSIDRWIIEHTTKSSQG